MKPTITWVLLADAQSARIVMNAGPGKGFSDVPGKQFKAAPPTEYADTPGQGQSSHGPGRAAMTRRDPKAAAAKAFAKRLADDLAEAQRAGHFARLVLVAGPQMLGDLREALSPPVRAALLGELDKTLTEVALADLPEHLADILAS
ncbi:host attachment protein [Roseobacter sp. HKCCD9010]|uniref:host attachment protein n=1 Tax=unclassified Roseobacter TaxID=196798 RepID=UPI001490D864|nr:MULTISPECIES: host attachment protein [unclassified Roseobacter]MBF9050455.1 host attachment protein [Rhodobacterales bacterium HKCCD4356]NNV12128.1 host attachment protein [Roseobacter sp. HKCCD7357]NNV17142.1 host attachment protein [Roseobacter sp. HKCCD8768]NNV26371.1 host attachment protein [Roseobacter sp. HKCCD8192]NNV30866.1 host attachment protein [Roseobacter sp. HKCCD9061]